MMEAYKRATVEAWCEDIAAPPFVPTINKNEKPEIGATLWFTVAWEPDTVEPIAFCGTSQETGQLIVIVGGEPNVGDLEVAAAADGIITALVLAIDPTGQLTLESVGAPLEDTQGSADRWYRLRVPINYRLISGG